MSDFTPAQQAAIGARGNVLVVAGAGTGKTRTLIARVLALLHSGASLDQFLLVTFTEAAAAEMRARLRNELERTLAELAPSAADSAFRIPHSALDHLAEQLALLDAAPISTLHSFSLRLVREHFHHLGIDPQLVILDERQSRPLARETLTSLLAEHYAGRHAHSSAVQSLIRRAGRGSDEPLRALVEKLHRYTQSLPDPDQWLTDQLAAFGEPVPTQWEVWLAEALAEWRAEWLPAFAAAPDVPALKRSAAALSDPAFRIPHSALEEILAADADWPRGTKTKSRPPYAKFFEEAAFFHGLFAPASAGDSRSPAHSPLAEDWDWCRHEMAALVELTRQFTARFAEAKRQLGGVDFADLEQFTLRLLRDETTGAARACRARFAHVCVDEYQDINAAQDAILRAVSRADTDANRFLVGDLKQSIYRFRLADPRIFAGYARAWREPSAAKVLALSENFRSRAAVLDFVNALCRTLMRESVGGVAYDAAVELKFGGERAGDPPSPPPKAAPRVELHVLTPDADEPDDDSDATSALLDLLAVEREARCVALRLRALHDAGHAWRDMVVLMRSPSSRVEAFAQEFHRAGVPLQAARGGFYEALEVSDLLNLLRLLDNPLQDLPLLAVLRSPLVGLSLEELIAIRAHNEERLFWDALTKGCAAGGPRECGTRNAQRGMAEAALAPAAHSAFRTSHTAFQKISAFLSRFAAWRERLRLSSLTDCLERALTETHYETLLLAEPRGAERVANVRRLFDLARQFDPYQRQGLHRFLQFIAAQTEADLDHGSAPAPTDDAVRLMSIHQSKGLEFPVVVLAGLGTRFNEQDLRGDILLDERFGLCPRVSPPGREQRYASLPHWLAARRGRRELLGEELRLLYVALTRARDVLLLAGTHAGKDAAAKWRTPAELLTDRVLLKARCPLDWLRAWLPSVTTEHDWRSDVAGECALFEWNFYSADDFRLAATAGVERRLSMAEGATPTAKARTAASATVAPGSERSGSDDEVRLRAMLDWTYPHTDATHEPAKTSVTVLRRRAAAEEDEATPWFRPRGGTHRSRNELSATQLGMAHHTFLQCVDFSRAVTELDLRNEAARLEAAGFLTARDVAGLDFAALMSFWESPVGQTVRAEAKAGRVQREVPFTARFTVAELQALNLLPPAAPLGHPAARPSSEEFLIVQGVADLVVFRPDEIWLLDYKTDHFPETDLPAKLHEYGPQLTLYAAALERIHPQRVTRTWLHFLALGRTENV